MAKKKYGLHCFGCGWQFDSKKDVCRVEGDPYCCECEGNYYQDQASIDAYNYEMKEWHLRHPGVDYEQWQIDRANIARYGEC